MPANKEATVLPLIDPKGSDSSANADPQETREWLEVLEGMVDPVGFARAAYVLKQLELRAQELGVSAHAPVYSAYQKFRIRGSVRGSYGQSASKLGGIRSSQVRS